MTQTLHSTGSSSGTMLDELPVTVSMASGATLTFALDQDNKPTNPDLAVFFDEDELAAYHDGLWTMVTVTLTHGEHTETCAGIPWGRMFPGARPHNAAGLAEMMIAKMEGKKHT